MGLKASNFVQGEFVKPTAKEIEPKASLPSFDQIRKAVGPTIQEELPLEDKVSSAVAKTKIPKKAKPKSSKYMDDMINDE